MTESKKKNKKEQIRIAVVITHAIQYQVPFFRELAKDPMIDLTVYYFCKWGAYEYYDPQMGTRLKWDMPLLDGYKYRFLSNLSPLDSPNKFFGLVNPGIIKELIVGKYDAVVIHGYAIFSYLLTYIGAWISRTPVMFRGETVLRENESLLRNVFKNIVLKILFKNTSAFLSIIRKSQEFYKYYNVPDNQIFYTPYSIDNDYFIKESKKWRESKTKIKKELGYKEDLPLILFVGKLVERKRPFDLLYAYEQLKDKAGLIFVGDGKLKIDLQSYCDKKHLERVRFIGFVNQSELPKYYALSDIFVLPSSSKEVSPLVINEAMCSSLPVVVSDAVPSATDYIKNGDNGYVYEFGNLSQLRDCIYTLLTNKSIRLEMGDSSLQHIVNYSNRHNTVKILEALSSIKQ
ncbi:MAG: glycosyltransferase family 4 protein [Candidatus Hodarchaeales archaeon]